MTETINDSRRVRRAWRAMLWGGLALLLLTPALAMQLDAPGVDWSASDFVIMGVLLAALGTGVELAMRLRQGRLMVIAVVLAGFLMIWAELAVGVFGTPFAGS